MSFRAHDTVFFLGAGASAPFGIPTMKQMVANFNEYISEHGTPVEVSLYMDIKKTLERTKGNNVDLESVFTVIDGIINYSDEKLDLLASYLINNFYIPKNIEESLNSIEEIHTYGFSEEVIITSKSLKIKFQNFVKESCHISEENFDRIGKVYFDLFNGFIRESTYTSSNTYLTKGNHQYCPWPIFTTNYDLCIEHYWRIVAHIPLNTGFTFDQSRNTPVFNYNNFTENNLKLIKLHGSLSWLIEDDGTLTERESPPVTSLAGRKYIGEMMIYPLQQKELYFEPYITMFTQLNRELKARTNWVIIGYSFNDPVIQEIFIRNSNKTKKIVLVHPFAPKIRKEKLDSIRCESFATLNKKFGEDNYGEVNNTLIKQLTRNPKHPPEKRFY